MTWPSDIPEASVGRLSTYLSILRRLEQEGEHTTSSAAIAETARVNPAQVRKDLSYFGDFGRRGVGYPVSGLREHLVRILGVGRERKVVVIGAGNMGAALAGYPGFGPRGFRIVGLFEKDPAKIGQVVSGERIIAVDRLAEVTRETGAEVAIIAVPASSAQEAVDQALEAGIQCILNLAPARVSVPRGVVVRNVDMTSQLELLSFCLAQSLKTPEGEQS